MLVSRKIGAAAVLAAGLAAPTARAQVVTFVQITDPHLYDAGRGRPGEGALVATVEHQAALLEAILAINRLVRVGARIDFVAITGDIGVGALDAAAVEARAAELARALGALLTRRIFILSGERDLLEDTPLARQHFQKFTESLRRSLGSTKELIDLTQTPALVEGLHIIGLDSRSFMADPSDASVVAAEVRAGAQTRELHRVEQRVPVGQSALILTHVPPIVDLGSPGGKALPLWTVVPAAQATLDHLMYQREVLGIFSGHVHVNQPDFYGRRMEMSLPASTVGRSVGVWVAPPLGRSASTDGKDEQLPGFLIVTITSAGYVTVTPQWLTPAGLSSAWPDKSGDLFKGQAYEASGELDDALKAYDSALSSTDTTVRRSAENGFHRTRERRRSPSWRLVQGFPPVRLTLYYYEYAIGGAVLAGILLVGFGTFNYRRRPIVDTPTKLADDAPADLFAAELRLAVPEARRMIDAERLRGSFGPSTADFSFATPMGAEWQKLLGNLPTIGEVDMGALVAAVFGVLRRFRRRIEIGVGGSVEDVHAFGTLWRGAKVIATWRVFADEDGPLNVRRAADQMAYNLLWELRRK